jgi:hypothetical protein
MNALKLVMTTAGLGRFTAAQTDNGVDLTVNGVGFTAQAFVAAPSLTALPGEFRRVSTVSGESLADNIVHLTVQDDAAVTYTVTGFGMFLADGTLFATYSQALPIVEKSTGSMLALAIDIVFPQAGVENITFGSTDFLNPPATTDKKGVVELATYAEADAADTTRVTTGAVVKAMLATAIAAVSEAIDGLMSRTIYGYGLVKGGGSLGTNLTFTVDTATAQQIQAGTGGDVAVTPAGLAGAGAVYVVAQALSANGGYRVWSDGLKECWGSVFVAANVTVFVPMPIEHTAFVVPAGAPGSIAQDEQSMGVSAVTAAGFSVRNENPVAATFYWHSKGV